MRKALILLGLVVGGILAAVLAVALVGGSLFVRRTFPTVNGTLRVAGLHSTVEVYRDKWGVPHIYAQDAEDLFFAQGYVTAQDRLWQLEFNRRVGSGTLSEICGEATLDTDRFIRTLGWRRVAEEEAKALEGETLAALEAYSAGVNAFIDSHRGSLPLEFTILGFEPEPWTPADSISWAKVMAWDLGGNWEAELLRAQLIDTVGEEKAAQLAPPYPDTAPLIVPPELGGYANLNDQALLQGSAGLRELLAAGSPGLGSNNWVVHGSRSATGQPLLANDMHLGLQIPSIWYEVHLVGGGFNVEGYSFPGVPGVIVGHNEHIAWGVTNLGPDVQDLYIEKVNPANPDQYEYQGQWVDMEIAEETIEVSGQDPVMERVQVTRHGPIITPVVEGLEQVISFRWTALEPNNVMESVLMLDRASNWGEFKAALELWAVPSQNFVYADVEGNIGYQAPGLIPVRSDGHAGLVPIPGWTGEYEWQGYIPFEELPSTLNPPTGFIVTANNKVVSDDYPYVLAYDFSLGHRAQRITDLLSETHTLSVDDMQRIHADVYTLAGELFTPYILDIEPEGFLQERALNELRDWDYRCDGDTTGAAIFHVFYMKLVENTFGDELGDELLEQYLDAWTWHYLTLEEMIEDDENPWFDDVTTSELETRDDIVLRSFVDALDYLGNRFGDVPHAWKWGRLHGVTFVHQPLGESGIAVLEGIFNRGPVKVGGSGDTVNAASFDPQEPYSTTTGVSQRLIVDLSNFDNSLSTHATGQSGLAFHGHYDDMISLWQAVEYHPLLWSQDAIKDQREGLLLLEPAG
ncbi:MAG TPA: penicillin acylase family protein [Chloroflexi bacterium]|nr:penicillin acylase family protein [Chloroflexota bacterium]